MPAKVFRKSLGGFCRILVNHSQVDLAISSDLKQTKPMILNIPLFLIKFWVSSTVGFTPQPRLSMISAKN
ncbi:hypothetical protein [Nostoc sp. NOS(2021)]|uniref:hypothetical protein n=1 Tax=Nostoc sp. NOS(2021) TaxID=2815407 RepID=UPI0025F0B4FE|nr:hypothetical protein [Nostoc sp. NOS(2021)]